MRGGPLLSCALICNYPWRGTSTTSLLATACEYLLQYDNTPKLQVNISEVYGQEELPRSVSRWLHTAQIIVLVQRAISTCDGLSYQQACVVHG